VRTRSNLIPLSVALALAGALVWTARQPRRPALAYFAPWLERGAVNADPPDAAPFADLSHGVAYDCEWLPARPPCPFDAGALDGDLAILRTQAGAGWGSIDLRPSDALDRVLARFASLDVAGLSARERVFLQSEVLGVAIATLDGPRPMMMMGHAGDEQRAATRRAATRRAAIAAMVHLALPPSDLDRLGSEPEHDLDAWLGPRASWVDKRTPAGELAHDVAFGHRMHFRPVLAGSVRAIFGQLAAIDTAWRAHVTPFVAELELRRGRAHAAPACLAHFEPSCGLRPDSPALAVSNPFSLGAGNGRVFCEMCHFATGAAANPRNLAPAPPSEAAEIVDARRDAFLTVLQSSVARLRDPATLE
jgi:hypothetical protein